MRAVICTEYGGPEKLVIGTWPSEELGSKDIRVRVHAASVNLPDTLIIQGRYQLKPSPPFVPGFDIAGEVIEVGPSVAEFRSGDRVVGLVKAGYGAFAEEAVTDSVHAVGIPEEMDFVSATAFYTSYGTSFHALRQRARLRAGETLLVLGAAGGVGLAAVEIGKSFGARVIAAAGSDERVEIAMRHGADQGINYGEGDVREQLRALTGASGVDVCLDAVGGDVFDWAAREMNYDGRLLIVGFASGRVPSLPANLALLKCFQLVGVWWNKFLEREPEANRANCEELFDLYRARRLLPVVSGIYPLEEVSDALNDVLARRAVGKLVLRVGL